LAAADLPWAMGTAMAMVMGTATATAIRETAIFP
jgi:hypothetical protein